MRNLIDGVVPEGFTKSDLSRFFDTARAIANDPNGEASLESAIFEDGRRQTRAAFKFSTRDAKKIQETTTNAIREIERDVRAEHQRVLMIFTRTDVGRAPIGKKSGERVLIKDVHPKPLAIMYASELDTRKNLPMGVSL